MSEHEQAVRATLWLWRGKAVAERVMDECGEAIDTHEGVFLALQLAYAEGVSDGSDLSIAALRDQLAAL